MPVFTPPTAADLPWVNEESPPLAARLFRFYGPSPRGRSVVKIAGVYVTVDSPDQITLTGLADGVDFFLGGHVYTVSDAVAAALTTDGFGAYLS